jgi:hypothetical protein
MEDDGGELLMAGLLVVNTGMAAFRSGAAGLLRP